jgi:Mg2+-importing ATPase
MTIIPKKLGAPRHPSEIQVSPEIMEVSVSAPGQVYQKLETSNQGLSAAEAARRLKEHGQNVVAQDKRHNRLRLLGRALVNPLVILLSVLAVISAATGDIRSATVMSVMVILGVVLRFVQEARADTAAAKLKAMISVNATVVRDGQTKEVPLAQLVPGDVVHLAAGDMIPADIRLISCKDLFIIQASLTGESFPVEKFATQEASKGLAAEHLFPWNQRGARHGFGRGGNDGLEDLFGQHSQRLGEPGGADQLRQRGHPVYLVNDPLYSDYGAAGFCH